MHEDFDDVPTQEIAVPSNEELMSSPGPRPRISRRWENPGDLFAELPDDLSDGVPRPIPDVGTEDTTPARAA